MSMNLFDKVIISNFQDSKQRVNQLFFGIIAKKTTFVQLVWKPLSKNVHLSIV